MLQSSHPLAMKSHPHGVTIGHLHVVSLYEDRRCGHTIAVGTAYERVEIRVSPKGRNMTVKHVLTDGIHPSWVGQEADDAE